MSGLTGTHNQAVVAAKKGQWQEAIALNLEIAKQEPKNTAALNRLGIAYLQTGEMKKAIQVFKQILTLDKNNQIAKKNLKRSQSAYAPSPSFNQPHFIEEPGKTRGVELHRLADKNCLSACVTGAVCALKCKKRYISIEINGKYIGALPEDLSFRLSRLIEKGNQYLCYLHNTSDKSCSVYLKEVFRSSKNQDATSFPVARVLNNGDESESVLVDDDIPVEANDRDKEEETEEQPPRQSLDFE